MWHNRTLGRRFITWLIRSRCDGGVPGDSIKRVSLPHRTMQSMLNRITINCINSKNSTDSKHRPSVRNRCSIAETLRSRVLDNAIQRIYRFYEGLSAEQRHTALLFFISWAEITSFVRVYLRTPTLFITCLQLFFVVKHLNIGWKLENVFECARSWGIIKFYWRHYEN